MELTHYFSAKNPTDLSYNWNPFIENVRKLFAYNKKTRLDKVKGVLVGPLGEQGTRPKANKKCVAFNGLLSLDEGCETFLFNKVLKNLKKSYFKDDEKTFDFCKTNGRPYDIYVMATLLLVKKHFQDKVEISTDSDLSDWDKAVILLNAANIHEIPTPDSVIEF